MTDEPPRRQGRRRLNGKAAGLDVVYVCVSRLLDLSDHAELARSEAATGFGMIETPVTYEAKDGLGWITLNRPAVLNALTTELAETLAARADAAAADQQVKLVMVRGAGRAFCSGMDRTALAARTIGDPFFRHCIRALNCLEDMPKIAVAVLHGHSIGNPGRCFLCLFTVGGS